MVLIAFRKRKIGMRKWVKGHSKKARRAVYGASGIVMTEKDMELAERGNPAESDKATEEAMLAVPPEAIGKMKLRQRERLRWQGNRLMDLFEKNPENLRLLREAQEAEKLLERIAGSGKMPETKEKREAAAAAFGKQIKYEERLKQFFTKNKANVQFIEQARRNLQSLRSAKRQMERG